MSMPDMPDFLAPPHQPPLNPTQPEFAPPSQPPVSPVPPEPSLPSTPQPPSPTQMEYDRVMSQVEKQSRPKIGLPIAAVITGIGFIALGIYSMKSGETLHYAGIPFHPIVMMIMGLLVGGFPLLSLIGTLRNRY